ncbi:MAG TPA: HlyD family type I secretion periplasmic adaptor subunit [Paracoccaceae bacterium]
MTTRTAAGQILGQTFGQTSGPTLKTGMTVPVRLGALASLALLIIVFFWLQTTMISGAIIASGQAVVRGKPKLIQSLDGGVVAGILVEDGDVVRTGDVLLKLDPTLLNINLDIYRNRLAEVIARESRLEAEYLGEASIAFRAPPLALEGIALDKHYTGQQEIFEARRLVLDGRKEQLQERILQFGNQIAGVEGQITSMRDQLAYVERELTSLRTLTREGLARESQLLELQRTQAGLLGQQSEFQAKLAEIRNSIRDTELEILQSERQFGEEVVTELRTATAEREELTLQIVTIEKQLERVEILAPADGVIHEMQVSTVGGVVPPEATIMQIVPLSEGVEFEIRVDPKSIDQIFVGQSAKVVFPAFDMRSTPEIFGTLAVVPPSSVTDPATGQSYFRVGLSVPPEELARLGNVELIPGMPVEAFLQTGERSVMSYLTKPLMDQLQRAFRDG